MNALILLAHLLLLGGLSFALARKETSLRNVFIPALVIKVLAGIFLGLVYQHYYSGGDTFVYFNDAGRFAHLARQDFAEYLRIVVSGKGLPGETTFGMDEPRALFLVKITSVFHLITGGGYWVTAIYFSVLSFLGSWYLVKKIVLYFPEVAPSAIIAFLFFPSVVFWTSGVIKESIAMGALYFLAGFFLETWVTRSIRIWPLVLALISLWVTWKLKYYFTAVFAPVAITTFVHRYITERWRGRNFVMQAGLWLLILVIPVTAVTFLHPNFSPQRFLSVIVENNRAFMALSDPNDVIHFFELETDLMSVLKNAPLAVVSGLFRPGVWEVETAFQWIIAIENLAIVMLTVLSLTMWKTAVESKNRMLVFALLVYILVLCVFITLSTPNFGTLTRYRVGYLPFFLFLVTSNKKALSVIQRTARRLVLYKR